MAMPQANSLPTSKSWRYRPYDFTQTTLAAGETRVIIDLRKSGWILVGGVFCNNPLLRWIFELEDPTQTYRYDMSLFELNTYGGNQACNSWWISVYNIILGLYAVQFSPAQWMPFYSRFKFSLNNPTAAPIVVFRTSVLAVEILDTKDKSEPA